MNQNTSYFCNDQPQRAKRHPLPWCWLLLCLGLIGAGCQQEAKVATDVDPVGTYALVSVDGKNVPCTMQHDGAKLEIKSGSFVINADGTCVSKMIFTPPSGTEATREVKATFTREGSALTMKWEKAGMTTGTVQGNTFTMNNEGMVLAYRK